MWIGTTTLNKNQHVKLSSLNWKQVVSDSKFCQILRVLYRIDIDSSSLDFSMQAQVSSQGLVQTPDWATQPGLVRFQLEQSHPMEVIHGSMLLHFLHLIYTFVQYPPSGQIRGFEFDPSASCTRWALSQQRGVFVLCDVWKWSWMHKWILAGMQKRNIP